MALLRLSTVALIFIADAIYALARGNNMYTLHHTGAGGMIANVASLIVASGLFGASPRGRRLLSWASRKLG